MFSAKILYILFLSFIFRAIDHHESVSHCSRPGTTSTSTTTAATHSTLLFPCEFFKGSLFSLLVLSSCVAWLYFVLGLWDTLLFLFSFLFKFRMHFTYYSKKQNKNKTHRLKAVFSISILLLFHGNSPSIFYNFFNKTHWDDYIVPPSTLTYSFL